MPVGNSSHCIFHIFRCVGSPGAASLPCLDGRVLEGSRPGSRALRAEVSETHGGDVVSASGTGESECTNSVPAESFSLAPPPGFTEEMSSFCV